MPTGWLLKQALFAFIATVAPASLVLFCGGIITDAARSSLQDRVIELAHDGSSFAQAAASVVTESTALDTVLVVYLAWAAVIATIGSLMRALAHGSRANAMDFAGKCLAVSSGVIVATGAVVRFSAQLADWLPVWFYLVVLVGTTILIFVFLIGGRWIAGRPEADEPEAPSS